MTLTLNIPDDPGLADAAYRHKLRRAAAALLDAGLVTAEQAAELAGPVQDSPAAPVPLEQGSPEWMALLYRIGAGRAGVILSEAATSRESIYEDDER